MITEIRFGCSHKGFNREYNLNLIVIKLLCIYCKKAECFWEAGNEYKKNDFLVCNYQERTGTEVCVFLMHVAG